VLIVYSMKRKQTPRAPKIVDRRSGVDRRGTEIDRREFPPRPEGRRHNGGRRKSDAPDA
jgi:hypothetical protein